MYGDLLIENGLDHWLFYTKEFLRHQSDNIDISSLVCTLVHLMMYLVGQKDSLMDFRLQVVSKLSYRIYVPGIKSSRAL